MADQSQTKSSGWAKTKHGSKAAFDKGWALFEKLGAPVNKLTNKIGSEAFWPTELGPECDKSARILKSFCKDGFYKDQPKSASSSPGPKNKAKVLVKIPQKVIQNCVGIAIFSVMRTGLWISGAGGSGVLLAKDERGNWSPPSGILIHTLGVGFMAGIDIYDCVLVINNREALAAFSKVRVSLGSEVSIVAGPLGIGGVVESELTKDRRPVFSYMKSRGLYGGIQLDGTIIIERNDENARFYGQRLPIKDILDGHVKHLPPQTHMLLEVVKAAEGRSDVDQSVMQTVYDQPPPGDMEVEAMSHPTAQQAAAYAPPPDYYAPNEDQKYLHSQYPGSPSYDGSHPSHPGPPDGSYSYPHEKVGGGGSAAQGQIESDAALAARLQAEEDNSAAAPPQPPRPLQSQAHYPQDQYPQQDYQTPTGPPTGYGQSVYQADHPGYLTAVHGPAQSNYQPPATAHGAVQQSQDGPYLQGQTPQMQTHTEQHTASYPGSHQTQQSQPGAPYYYPPPPTEPSR